MYKGSDKRRKKACERGDCVREKKKLQCGVRRKERERC